MTVLLEEMGFCHLNSTWQNKLCSLHALHVDHVRVLAFAAADGARAAIRSQVVPLYVLDAR